MVEPRQCDEDPGSSMTQDWRLIAHYASLDRKCRIGLSLSEHLIDTDKFHTNFLTRDIPRPMIVRFKAMTPKRRRVSVRMFKISEPILENAKRFLNKCKLSIPKLLFTFMTCVYRGMTSLSWNDTEMSWKHHSS